MRRCAALLVLALAGCPDAPVTTSSCSHFVGDPGQPPSVALVYRTADGGAAPVTEGVRLPLYTPPQGGKMVFPSIQVRNMDTCAMDVVGSLRDECSNRVVGLEGRPVNLYSYPGQTAATPAAPEELQNFANVPLCPNAGSSRDIYDESYRLEVRVTDKEGRTATVSAHVTPYCAEPSRLLECLCSCKKGYRLGETCSTPPIDAGMPNTCPTDAGVDAF